MILSSIIAIPLLGILLICLSDFICLNSAASVRDGLSRLIALCVTLFLLCFCMYSFSGLDYAKMQLVEHYVWIEAYDISYHVGVDGLSVVMILLTAFLVPICILASWRSLKEKVKQYVCLFLLLESFMIGVFCACDLLLFYIFFEAVLIPMFFIIGVFGGINRIYAAFKLFLYTLFGSIFMLIALIYIYTKCGSTDMLLLRDVMLNEAFSVQCLLWLAFFIAFAIKVPMWPVHTWLPDAHVQAPTGGSVILAGILLKLGVYGMIRVLLNIFPEVSFYFADYVFYLSIIAVIYTSLVALMQKDMKKLIAYSSIAHMGYVTAGLFSFNEVAFNGAVFQMVSHGLVSGALFLCVGVLYDRMHTKEIAFYGGLTSRMPAFAFIFLLFTMASIGLPITSGFVGEFMVLAGVFEYSAIFSLLLATGMVLGAAYMLWLFARVMFGEITNKKLSSVKDLCFIEHAVFWPIVFLVLLLGIYPSIVTDYLSGISIASLSSTDFCG